MPTAYITAPPDAGSALAELLVEERGVGSADLLRRGGFAATRSRPA